MTRFMGLRFQHRTLWTVHREWARTHIPNLVQIEEGAGYRSTQTLNLASHNFHQFYEFLFFSIPFSFPSFLLFSALHFPFPAYSSIPCYFSYLPIHRLLLFFVCVLFPIFSFPPFMPLLFPSFHLPSVFLFPSPFLSFPSLPFFISPLPPLPLSFSFHSPISVLCSSLLISFPSLPCHFSYLPSLIFSFSFFLSHFSIIPSPPFMSLSITLPFTLHSLPVFPLSLPFPFYFLFNSFPSLPSLPFPSSLLLLPPSLSFTDQAEIWHESVYQFTLGCSWSCCRFCSDWGRSLGFLVLIFFWMQEFLSGFMDWGIRAFCELSSLVLHAHHGPITDESKSLFGIRQDVLHWVIDDAVFLVATILSVQWRWQPKTYFFNH